MSPTLKSMKENSSFGFFPLGADANFKCIFASINTQSSLIAVVVSSVANLN